MLNDGTDNMHNMWRGIRDGSGHMLPLLDENLHSGLAIAKSIFYALPIILIKVVGWWIYL